MMIILYALVISTQYKRVLTESRKRCVFPQGIKHRKTYLIYKEAFIMKLVPLGDRVVLQQLKAEETTKSGIVLPGQDKEKPQQAEVIAVGPGGMVDGKEVKMEVKKGDKVIYSKYSGTEVKLDEDEKLVIVKQSDILAVIK
jgi:chaperonin GroES